MPRTRDRQGSSVWRVLLTVFFVSWALCVFVFFRQRTWRGANWGTRTFLVVHDVDPVRKPMTLIQLEQASRVVRTIPLPPAQRVPLPFENGEYTTDALVGFTQLDTWRWQFLMLTVALQYGVVVDGVIWTEQPVVQARSEVVALVLRSVTRPTYTTLPLWDRFIWLSWLLRGTTQVAQADISAVQTGSPPTLDTTRYDQSFASGWFDAVIRDSSTVVAIANGSGIDGLAGRFGRALGLMGYDVRGVETVADQENTRILLRDDLLRKSWSAQRLQQLFPPGTPVVVDSAQASRSRADIVVQFGKDLTLIYRRPENQ